MARQGLFEFGIGKQSGEFFRQVGAQLRRCSAALAQQFRSPVRHGDDVFKIMATQKIRPAIGVFAAVFERLKFWFFVEFTVIFS